MTDLSTRLRDADPLSTESGLSAIDAAAIRRTVVAAADQEPASLAPWPRPLFLAATLAATIVVGVAIGTGRQAAVTRAQPPRAASAAGVAATPDERRQLQFATPGGTRIIWVFDPQFNP